MTLNQLANISHFSSNDLCNISNSKNFPEYFIERKAFLNQVNDQLYDVLILFSSLEVCMLIVDYTYNDVC